MKQRIRKLAERIDALSLRERALVLLAVVAVLFMVWDTFMMQPLYQEQERIEADIATRQASISRLAGALQTALQQRDANPNVRLQREKEELEQRIAELDERLSAETANIISPRRMATVLQEVLRRQKVLQLVEMRSLSPEAVLAVQENAEFALQGNIYRHGIVMEIEGSYLDLLDYLREIEALPYGFVWDELEIETEQYPRNRIVLRVFTLSLSEGLIGA